MGDPRDLIWEFHGRRIQIVWAEYEGERVIRDVDVWDVEGRHWFGVMATLEQIQERLDHYREFGECADGRYFWAAGLIVVADMDDATLKATIENLITEGEFEDALRLVQELDDA